jgi:hypothetical protein
MRGVIRSGRNRKGWWGVRWLDWLDLVGPGWTYLDWNDAAVRRTLPGVVLPVRPSTFHVWKHLQKLYPSGYPSEAVRDPSGFCAEHH